MKPKDLPGKLVDATCKVVSDRRAELGMSVYSLSQLSGVSQQAIGYLEKGTRRPSLETMAKLAPHLGLRLSELIARAEKRLAK